MKKLIEGEYIPIGISWAENRPRISSCNSYFMRIPILLWKIKEYDICIDEMIFGWHSLNVIFRIDKFDSGKGIGFQFNYGWKCMHKNV